MTHRYVFMGTPDFAVPSLQRLADLVDPSELLVLTQPDRPAGRGRRLLAPPVKSAADELGLETMQVMSLRDVAVRARLEAASPDLIVVAAFGLLLPGWVLRLPSKGCVNLHASLLPRFRGASPIAAAIASGDAETGVGLMEMERGLDTGAVFAEARLQIGADATTESLTLELAEVAADLLAASLPGLLAGSLVPAPQRGEIVETRKLAKAHGRIDWDRSAEEIGWHVRAMWPWPRAWTEIGHERLQVHRAAVAERHDGVPVGTARHHLGALQVAASDRWVTIEVGQLAGRSAIPGSLLLAAPALRAGAVLGAEPADPVAPWLGVTLL